MADKKKCSICGRRILWEKFRWRHADDGTEICIHADVLDG